MTVTKLTQKIFILLFVFLTIFNFSYAGSELTPEQTTVMKGQVLNIIKEEIKNVPGTDIQNKYQTIEAIIQDGAEKGNKVTIENDYLSLKKGEVFYLSHTIDRLDDSDYYNVIDPYRLPQILTLVGLFIFLVFIFGGKQGIRGLLSLVGSFLLIFYVLLPSILHGYSPLLVIITVSSLIIILGSFITHGFNKTTSTAVIGMITTVVITGLLAYFFVYYSRLSGFGSEEAVYLNINSQGSIDIIGLLLGGIIIGLLGVLYDAAIGQAVAVEELVRIAPHVSAKIIYQRALRIGREHIGALVNTLAIAYVGASLPLMLLFYQASSSTFLQTINSEVFSTEIIRIMIGSIGLVIAVPITTFVAVLILTKKYVGTDDTAILKKEKAEIEQFTHSHSHSEHH